MLCSWFIQKTNIVLCRLFLFISTRHYNLTHLYGTVLADFVFAFTAPARLVVHKSPMLVSMSHCFFFTCFTFLWNNPPFCCRSTVTDAPGFNMNRLLASTFLLSCSCTRCRSIGSPRQICINRLLALAALSSETPSRCLNQMSNIYIGIV